LLDVKTDMIALPDFVNESGNVDKDFLSIICLDKTKSLGFIEEFYGAFFHEN